jgi:hypothetical protein
MGGRPIQSPEQTLERWSGIECKCDPDVGYMCEVCHDTQVLRDLIKERDRLLAGIFRWSYCASEGMKKNCPNECEDLAAFLLSCKIAPYYIERK